jgi:hypothetical protein
MKTEQERIDEIAPIIAGLAKVGSVAARGLAVAGRGAVGAAKAGGRGLSAAGKGAVQGSKAVGRGVKKKATDMAIDKGTDMATDKVTNMINNKRNKVSLTTTDEDEVSEAFSFYRRLGRTIYEAAGLPTGPIAKHYTGVKRKNIGDGKVKSDVTKAVNKIEKKIRTKVGPGADTPNLVAQAQKTNRENNKNRKVGLGPENPNVRKADFRADKERRRAPGDI